MAVAIALGSFLVVERLEDRLVANVDEQFASGAVDLDLRDQLLERGPRGQARIDRRSRVAVVRYGPEGAVLASVASGTDQDPDPLPDAADLDPDEGIETVGSTSDGPRYRAVSLRGPGGVTTVVAVTLEDVDATLREARRIQLAVGLGAIGVVGLLSWLLVRRAFSPIDGMITTAGRIADGDLDQRTEAGDEASEVGRLGTALNTMLDRIQSAVDEKSASEKRMRRFVADASHDLRTPLTSLRGYAELYRQGASDPEEVALGMERIEAEATRMGRLVDDLMLLARLDQQRSPTYRRVDAGRVVGEAVDAMRVTDHDRTWDLAVEGREPLVVMGDADQLRQVFDNLLGNAGAHTPPGTTVDVQARVDGDEVEIVIADDGPGFDDADRPRAFDRFWRATRADENPADGSGLGLSIVKSIVETHGGAVTLDRAASGGARFSVRFPLATSPVTERQPTK